jgi:hypothetical protein
MWTRGPACEVTWHRVAGGRQPLVSSMTCQLARIRAVLLSDKVPGVTAGVDKCQPAVPLPAYFFLRSGPVFVLSQPTIRHPSEVCRCRRAISSCDGEGFFSGSLSDRVGMATFHESAPAFGPLPSLCGINLPRWRTAQTQRTRIRPEGASARRTSRPARSIGGPLLQHA